MVDRRPLLDSEVATATEQLAVAGDEGGADLEGEGRGSDQGLQRAIMGRESAVGPGGRTGMPPSAKPALASSRAIAKFLMSSILLLVWTSTVPRLNNAPVDGQAYDLYATRGSKRPRKPPLHVLCSVMTWFEIADRLSVLGVALGGDSVVTSTEHRQVT